jgi:hypothetical protein
VRLLLWSAVRAQVPQLDGWVREAQAEMGMPDASMAEIASFWVAPADCAADKRRWLQEGVPARVQSYPRVTVGATTFKAVGTEPVRGSPSGAAGAIQEWVDEKGAGFWDFGYIQQVLGFSVPTRAKPMLFVRMFFYSQRAQTHPDARGLATVAVEDPDCERQAANNLRPFRIAHSLIPSHVIYVDLNSNKDKGKRKDRRAPKGLGLMADEGESDAEDEDVTVKLAIPLNWGVNLNEAD